MIVVRPINLSNKSTAQIEVMELETKYSYW